MCSVSATGDCKWRREYLRMKCEFESYQRKVDSELKKQSITEEKIVELMGQMERSKKVFQNELEDCRKREEENRKRFIKELDLNKHLKQVTEMENSELKDNVAILENENGQLAASVDARLLECEDLKRRLRSVQTENEVLTATVNTLEIKIEVEKSKLMDQTTKRSRAVADFVDLYNKYTDLKLLYAEKENELDEAVRISDKLNAESLRIMQENAGLQQNFVENKANYERKILKMRKELSRTENQLRKENREKFHGLTTEVAEFCANMNKNINLIATVISEDRFRDAEQREIREEIFNGLRLVWKNLSEEVKKFEAEVRQTVMVKSEVQIEHEALERLYQGAVLDMNRYIWKFSELFSELREIFGLPEISPLVAENPNGQVNNLEDEDDLREKRKEPANFSLFLQVITSQEQTFLKVIKELKDWKRNDDQQKDQVRERLSNVQQQLEQGKTMSIVEKDIMTKKLRVYKGVIMKLRDKLQRLLKPLEKSGVPAGRRTKKKGRGGDGNFNVQANVSTTIAVENYELFRKMLERAESEVNRIDTTRKAGAHRYPTESRQVRIRSGSLPNLRV